MTFRRTSSGCYTTPGFTIDPGLHKPVVPGATRDISKVAAARLLGNARWDRVAALQEAGIIGPRLYVDEITDLAMRPVIAVIDGKVVIVRVGGPACAEDGTNRVIGFSTAYTNGQVLNAHRGHWKIGRGEAQRIVDAGILVVTVATIVVSVLRITGIEKWGRYEDGTTRVTFEADLLARATGPTTWWRAEDLDADTDDYVTQFVHHRTPWIRGAGPIAWLTAEMVSGLTLAA